MSGKVLFSLGWFLGYAHLFFIIAFTCSWIFVQIAMQPCKSFKLAPDVAKNKVIIITGANSGLGFYTSLYLANNGAKVIMACRDNHRCLASKRVIMESSNLTNPLLVEPDVMDLDLGSFASIRSFVQIFKGTYASKGLDVLINNAGVMALSPPKSLTVDGIEAQVGINHFGHFLLTALLYPVLNKNGRIVNHASSAHEFAAADEILKGDFQTSDYNQWSAWSAYGKSKQANLQFTYEMNDRLASRKNPKNIIAIAIHPGYTSTALQEKSAMNAFGMSWISNKFLAMDLHDGSLSQIIAAVDPSVEASNNTYFGPRYVALGFPVVAPTGKYHKDAQVELWRVSEELTNQRFTI